MSIRGISQDFANYLYGRLPSIYRTEDKEQVLQRFIGSFAEGGFNPLLQETIDIMDLLDVDKCPSKFLPQLCRMYGYEYTLDIPELFQRRLLKYIVELYKRKGTKSVVRFIARELTGFESEIIENKDFDKDDIELTKWDIRFEHYRNFILKLTAPYENSNLYNKEDIVVRIVNDFLPTNSQVFVITSYWFTDESEVVKNSIMKVVLDTIQDYTGEMLHKATEQVLESETTHNLATRDEYAHAFMYEEDSYLNYPLEGMKLMTNAVVNIRDTVKFAMEVYNRFITTMETLETNVLVLQETELFKPSIDYSYLYGELVKVQVELEEYTNVVDFVLSDSILDPTHKEEVTLDKNGVYNKDKVCDLTLEELNQSSRTREVDCDIIKPLATEFTHSTLMKDLLGNNNKLNVNTQLLTNGIMFYDIIKEKGKPDRLILL